MARAYGHSAQLLFAYESTYGVAPASGAYYKLPFIQADLGGNQALLEADLLGLGREPLHATYDLLRVTGSITVPVDVRNIGFWLKLMCGNATVTGAGPYAHEWKSGGASLPSATIEIGFPEAAAFYRFTGIRGNSIQFSLSRTGQAQAVIQLLGAAFSINGTAVDATPNTLTVLRFNQTHGSIERGGTDLGSVISADMTFSNNLESVETLRADQLVEAIDPGINALTGSITQRLADTVLPFDAFNQAVIKVDLEYNDGTNILDLEAHEVRIPVAPQQVSGPGGVEATYNWQAGQDSSGDFWTATLTNDHADYVNAV